MQKKLNQWIILAMLLLPQIGCGWLNPNVISLRLSTTNGNSGDTYTTEADSAYHHSETYRSFFEEVRFHNLQPNTTYWFWLSPVGTKWKPISDVPSIEVAPEVNANLRVPIFQRPDSSTMKMQRKLDLTLMDENRNMLRYNDDYVSYWNDGSDTLAAIRYRTGSVVAYETVLLRVGLCEDPHLLDRIPFEIHLTCYYTPDMVKRSINWEPGAMPMKLQVDPTELRIGSCDTFAVAEVDTVSQSFDSLGNVRYITGAPYDTGSGFDTRNQRCSGGAGIPDDRLEYCLHNFKPFWFVPHQDGLYELSLTDMGTQKDKLGIAIFYDEFFQLQQNLSRDSTDNLIERRAASICGDMQVGVKMIGSGKHRGEDTLYAGESENNQQGIYMEAGKVYYILVAAPMFEAFRCTLNISLSGAEANLLVPCGSTVNLPRVHYNVPCSLATFLGMQGSESNPNVYNPIGSYLPHQFVETQWRNVAWYSIQPCDVLEWDITVWSDNIEGKVAFMTFGDPWDATTYEKLKDQIFAPGTPQRLTINPPLRRELRMAIIHRPGRQGTIRVEMVPRMWTWNDPLDN